MLRCVAPRGLRQVEPTALEESVLCAGHTSGEPILSIAVSATSRYLATGDAQGIVKTWQLDSLLQEWDSHGSGSPASAEAVRHLAVWRAHNGNVSSIVFTTDSDDFFLTSGFDHDIKMWSPTGAHVGTFGNVRCCACTKLLRLEWLPALRALSDE